LVTLEWRLLREAASFLELPSSWMAVASQLPAIRNGPDGGPGTLPPRDDDRTDHVEGAWWVSEPVSQEQKLAQFARTAG
jgi:hypothetical protein